MQSTANEQVYQIKRMKASPCYCIERKSPSTDSGSQYLHTDSKSLLKVSLRPYSEIRSLSPAPLGFLDFPPIILENSFEQEFHLSYHCLELHTPAFVLFEPNLFDGRPSIRAANFSTVGSSLLLFANMTEVISKIANKLCIQNGDHTATDVLSDQFQKSVTLDNDVNSGDTQAPTNEYDVSKLAEDTQLTLCTNGFIIHGDTESSSSVSSSPSPVRSVVASPFAAATMKPRFPHSESLSLSDTICTPFDSDLSFTRLSRPHTIEPHFQSETLQKAAECDFLHYNEAYPEHLNPFSDEKNRITFHSPVFQCSPKEDCIVTPFDDFPDEYIRCTSRTFSPPVRGSTPAFLSRKSVSSKRRAPLPPPKFDETSSIRRTHQSRPNTGGSYTPPRSGQRSKTLNRTQRASSTGPRLTHSPYRAVCTETKSAVIKRQAPPLPVPSKRTIKADPEDQFISYGELHRKLHEIHQKLTDTERSSRAIFARLKAGSSKPSNINELLSQWTKLADVKESLLNQEAKLLERLHRQELEERHANVEHELRLLLAKQDALKTPVEKAREEELLRDLVSTVEKRAALIDHPTNQDSPTESSSKGKHLRPFTCLHAIRLHKKSTSSKKRLGHGKTLRTKKLPPVKSCLRVRTNEK